MVDLIVESGAIVPGANTYRSLENAQAFCDARDLGVVLRTSDMLLAMDALWSIDWLGEKVLQDSPLPWPRSGIYNREGYQIDYDVVPVKIGDAQSWLAWYINTGVDLNTRTEPGVRSESATGLSTTFTLRMGEKDTITLFKLPQVRRALMDYWVVYGDLNRA